MTKKGWNSGFLKSFVKDFIVPQRDKPKSFEGNIPWCRIEDFDGIYLSKSKSGQHVNQEIINQMGLKVYPVNTVIVSCSADLGRCAIIEKPLVTNQTFIGLVPESNLDSKFLFYYMSSRARQLNEMASGATIKYLSKKKFQELSVTFPPLPEQHRIVAILDRCFTAIDRAKTIASTNLQNARELFESYLNGVFEKGGKDWEVKKLGEVGKVCMCKRIFKDETKMEGEIPFYKIGTFGKKPDAFISKETYELYKKKFSFPKTGDILVSASGTIGRCVIYDGEPAYFQDSNIVWIDNDEKMVTNKFLHSFYSACKWESTKGATISRLYNDNLRQLIIRFPKSKTEQQHIVSQLDALQKETKRLEEHYTQKLHDLEELKKAVLQKAFSGELVTDTIEIPS